MSSVPPAGTSPAAAWSAVTIARPLAPPTILADRIDPLTGDFESLAEGRELADAFAIEALRVQRGTGAAVRDLGNRFRELTHVDVSGEIIESMVRDAFAPAVRAGVLELVRITTEVDASDRAQLNVAIDYRDLLAPAATNARRLVFPLGS